jgi:hypothetical protein
MPIPVKVLSAIGISPEDITVLSAIPEDGQETFDAKPYVDKVRANYQTQFRNDPEFFQGVTVDNLPPAVKKQLESGQYARATNIAKEKIAKALGFTEAEISDLATDDYKALDFFVPAIADKWTKTKSGDKELQNQLIEARKKLEGFNGFEDQIKTKYESEANQKITGAIFNAALIGELSSVPGLKISAGDIAKTAHDILQSKYSFERTGDYNVELRQKANPAMKVLKDGSSHELTLKEALLEIATERGWIESKPDEGKGSGKIVVTPGKNGTLTMVPPHLQDKISRHIATGS